MRGAYFVFLFLFLLLSPKPVLAHCPICSAATGALVASARVAGVDDVVVGTFIGAFAISTAFWISNFITRRFKRKIPFQPYALSVISMVSTIASFYVAGLLGTMPSFLYVFGMERLLFGILLGSALSIITFELHNLMRRYNGNKNHFPFQGMILPIAALIAANFAMYLLGVF